LNVRAASTLDLSFVLSTVIPPQIRPSPSPRLLDRGVWWGAHYGKDSIQELPSTRRIWSILENQETSTITDRLDIVSLETAGPARLKHLVDITAHISGTLPLARAGLPFFSSLSTQLRSKDLDGFTAPIDRTVYHVLTRFTPFSRGTRRLDFLYAGQHVFDSRQ